MMALIDFYVLTHTLPVYFPTKQDIKEAVHGDVFAVILLDSNIPWIIQNYENRWRHGRVTHSREYVIESVLLENKFLFRNQNDILNFREFRAPIAEEIEKLQMTFVANMDSIDGDGHCLFRAITKCLNEHCFWDEARDHFEVCRMIGQWIVENCSEIKNFFDEDEDIVAYGIDIAVGKIK
jgi:hypothetical protein